MGHREHVKCGQATVGRWAESSNSLSGRALRLSRMRCERGSVCVVSPAGSRFFSDNERATVWLSLAWIFTARLRRLLRLRVSRVDGLGGSPCDAIGLQRLRQG